MALSLNGIAQGYIADKGAALLRTQGVQDVLVNTGAFAALGQAPDAWLAGGLSTAFCLMKREPSTRHLRPFPRPASRG